MIIIKKILVPTDLSDSSRPAIGYALSLAKQHDAEVGVLHILSPQALKENLAPQDAAEPRALKRPKGSGALYGRRTR